jgi:4-amino-4-deoxy-L-arabinose transferase-like glycosyltransferase
MSVLAVPLRRTRLSDIAASIAPSPWLLGAVVALIAGCTRLAAADTAYDVYVDEFLYAELGRSVQAGNLPPAGDDGTFLVHPPGYFMWAAFWQSLLGSVSDPFGDVFLLRGVQQVLSIVTAVAVFAIARRAAGLWAGFAAGMLFALDPFVLRQNGRILLETATIACVVVGLWLVVRIAQSQSMARWMAPVAGILFGLALFTKDLAVFLTVVPLAILMVIKEVLPRQRILVILATSAIPYGLYVFWLAAAGLLPLFVSVKLEGLSRLVGGLIITGYNSESGPSLLEVILPQVPEFGFSFAVLALGGLAGLWLLLAPRTPTDRLIGLVTTCAEVFVVYGMLFGTSEEHLYYFAMVPAILSLVTSLARVGGLARWPTGLRDPAAYTAFAICLVLAAAHFSAWNLTRSSEDDAQADAAAWVESSVPPGSLIAWVAPQTSMSFRDEGYRFERLAGVDEMAASSDGQPFYLVVLEKEITEGYSRTTPAELAFFTQRADLMFTDESSSYDAVSIYRVWEPARW